MIHETIYQLYPAAVSIVNDIPYDIEGNAITVDMEDYNTLVSDTIAQLDLKHLRSRRDILLSNTDWVVTRATDQGVSIPTEWATYRQALRDITDTYTSIEDVVWPTKPD